MGKEKARLLGGLDTIRLGSWCDAGIPCVSVGAIFAGTRLLDDFIVFGTCQHPNHLVDDPRLMMRSVNLPILNSEVDSFTDDAKFFVQILKFGVKFAGVVYQCIVDCICTKVVSLLGQCRNKFCEFSLNFCHSCMYIVVP